MPAPEGIVILGISRSGTTLVRRILDAHPEVSAPAETLVLSAAARFLHSQPLGSGAAYGVRTGLSLAGFPEAEVLGRLRNLAFGFLREHAEAHDARLWAEKTATDVFHLADIEAVCGDAVHYVAVIRNGLDVAPSLLELVDQTGGYFEELHAFAAAEARPLVAMARAWAVATEALLDLQQRRPDRCHAIHYEHLVTHPDRELDRLADALGLSVPPNWLQTTFARSGSPGFGDWKTWSTEALHTGSIDRHRRLDRAVIGAMVEVAGPTLARAGYVVPEALDADQASRRAALAMRVASMRRS